MKLFYLQRHLFYTIERVRKTVCNPSNAGDVFKRHADKCGKTSRRFLKICTNVFIFCTKNKTVLQGLEKVFAEIRIKRKARFCYKQDEDKKRACPDDEHQSAGQALHISRITFQEYLPVWQSGSRRTWLLKECCNVPPEYADTAR